MYLYRTQGYPPRTSDRAFWHGVNSHGFAQGNLIALAYRYGKPAMAVGLTLEWILDVAYDPALAPYQIQAIPTKGGA